MGDIVDVEFKKENEEVNNENIENDSEKNIQNEIDRLDYYLTEMNIGISRMMLLQEYQTIVLSLEKYSMMAILSAINYANKNFEINVDNKNKFINACEHDLKIINPEIFDLDKIENKYLKEINSLSYDICRSFIEQQFYLITGNSSEYTKEQKKYGDKCVSLFNAFSELKKDIIERKKKIFEEELSKAKNKEKEESEENK